MTILRLLACGSVLLFAAGCSSSSGGNAGGPDSGGSDGTTDGMQSGTDPYCDNGHCTTAPCDGGACGGGMLCCGSECCTAGQLCCDVPSGIPTFPKCTDPVNGTCPVGCLGCP